VAKKEQDIGLYAGFLGENIPGHLNNVVLYTILLENILTHSLKHI
jgi:hypothetical protein